MFYFLRAQLAKNKTSPIEITKRGCMAIIFILRKREIPLEIEKTLMVKEALARLGFSIETHLVVRGGEMLNENEALRDGDRVKLIPVISGG
jgi:sulfur carrier protein